MNIENIIKDFLETVFNGNITIYNEASLQHEFGYFIRVHYPNLKVEFERNISYFYDDALTVKKEIDLVIYEDDFKYAIELKFPKNGQYPEQMFSFIKDIKFMEELKALGFDKTYTLTLTDDPLFYSGNVPRPIYEYFRSNKTITGIINKPTGIKDEIIQINGLYNVNWIKKNGFCFYLIEIGGCLL